MGSGAAAVAGLFAFVPANKLECDFAIAFAAELGGVVTVDWWNAKNGLFGTVTGAAVGAGAGGAGGSGIWKNC